MSTEGRRKELQIRPLQVAAIDTVITLAHTIWNRHYPGIIAQAQIDYMLDQRYTQARLAAELEDPHIDWSVALLAGRIVGFSSALLRRSGTCKLDKLYVDPDFHRRGIATALVAGVRSAATRIGCGKVELAVNRHNMVAIAAYQRFGFRVREARKTAIGGGFVMDDFIMAAPTIALPAGRRED